MSRRRRNNRRDPSLAGRSVGRIQPGHKEIGGRPQKHARPMAVAERIQICDGRTDEAGRMGEGGRKAARTHSYRSSM